MKKIKKEENPEMIKINTHRLTREICKRWLALDWVDYQIQKVQRNRLTGDLRITVLLYSEGEETDIPTGFGWAVSYDEWRRVLRLPWHWPYW